MLPNDSRSYRYMRCLSIGVLNAASVRDTIVSRTRSGLTHETARGRGSIV